MAGFPKPIDLLNKSADLRHVRQIAGIAYGGAPRQKLDLYVPERNAAASPVIVFYYGGSWQFGAREEYKFIAALFTAQGYIVAVPDYGVYPQTIYPEFVDDCALAANWVHANIGGYGGDDRQIFFIGHSAGAYNAVMVALRAGSQAPAAVIGLAGPYDFLPIRDPIIKEIFAKPEDPKDHQPVSYVHEEAPPMFLCAGGRDRTVLPRNTTALAARLRAVGAVVETKIYPTLGHIGLLLSLLPFMRWRAPVMRDVLSFLDTARAGEFSQGRSETITTMVKRAG